MKRALKILLNFSSAHLKIIENQIFRNTYPPNSLENSWEGD